ncbi:unnamed protein product [Phytomonas sp. EM1]|nr:unnamed protein product [Phytomonas sp. EM1]|eukprot:CCW63377.1 unnamed protein product [Phytomonas sp. isolate EM1]
MPVRRALPSATPPTTPPTGGSSSIVGGGGSDKTPKLSKPAPTDLPYTGEEKAFLASLRSPSSGGATLAKVAETWGSGTALEMLAGITEKILGVAAERFLLEQQHAGNARIGSSPSAGGGDPVNDEDGMRSSLVPETNSMAAMISGIPSFSTPLTPAQFAEENAYILEQLRTFPECPFTVQRLVEILENPFRHYAGAKDGGLRAEALQKAIRRCVMVTYPFTTGGGEEGIGSLVDGGESSAKTAIASK